jgi:PAS domain S-box-containing protein
MARNAIVHKRPEQPARDNDELFRLVANTVPALIWMSGPDKLCTYFNKPWLDFTGRPMETEIGNGWTTGVHPDDLRSCLKIYTQAFDCHESFTMNYRLRRCDGKYRWLFAVGVPRFTTGGAFAGYVGSCTDITEQRVAQQALKKLSFKFLDAQENERSRIARELHDDICQKLTILLLEIEQSIERSVGLPAQAKRLKQIWEHCNDITGDVQALSHELHSSMLDHLGMIAAMKSFCNEFSKRQNVVVKFTQRNVPSFLGRDVSLCLFRVMQEALRNAAKHSGVCVFDVQLLGNPDCIELEIRDAGVGFEQEHARNNGGLGLVSMEERVHLLKGVFVVDSGTKSGTIVRATVPLAREASPRITASEKVA